MKFYSRVVCKAYSLNLSELLLNLADIIRYKRLQWAGHMQGMSEQKVVEKVLNRQPLKIM